MSDLYQSLAHSKWDCKYHVVFVPKRRRKVIFGKTRQQLGGIFHALAKQKECQIVEGTLMPKALTELEAERAKILRQFSTLGDLRQGSICAVARRCGKPTCHCAKPKDGGHDPQVRLTRKVDGKTVAESFPSPAAWRKAQAEIDEYHRLQGLNEELVAINEKICKHRPLESNSSPWTPEEKKRLLRSMRRS